MNVSSGKAGRTRWQGRRPHVRGMSMNPIDHPMGGGQGKSKGGGGRHHPVSPWDNWRKDLKRDETQTERSIYHGKEKGEEEGVRPVILSEVERSRRIPWRNLKASAAGSLDFRSG